jgi:hypothetical protein
MVLERPLLAQHYSYFYWIHNVYLLTERLIWCVPQ